MVRGLSVILFFLLIYPKWANGQKWAIDVFGGASNYIGDLVQDPYVLYNTRGAVGIGISHGISSRLYVKAAITTGKYYAHDKNNRSEALVQRNLSVHSWITEFSTTATYDLLNIETSRITPDLFGGLAVFGFNPYTFEDRGAKVFLQPLSTEGQGISPYPDRKPYQLTQFSLPFGGGIRFRVNEKVSLAWEIGLRKTNTDYMDDVSTSYVDEAILLAERGSRAVSVAFRGDELKNSPLVYPAGGTVRGSPRVKDWYYFSGISGRIGIGDIHFPGKSAIACPTRF